MANKSAFERAKELPRVSPGVVVIVPLELLPEYLKFYHLEPVRYCWSSLAGDDVLNVRKEVGEK